jgi:hypothetical protein
LQKIFVLDFITSIYFYQYLATTFSFKGKTFKNKWEVLFMMLMSSDKSMKLGTALMAMGVAAAVTAGVVNSKNSTKRKMKKLAKKSVKTMDGILDNVQYMFK